MLAWIHNRASGARLSAGAALAAAALAAAGSAAAQPAARFMPQGEPAPAPIAFLSFCTRMPRECAPAAHSDSEALSAADMAVDASAQASAPAELATAALPEDAAAAPSASTLSADEAAPAAAPSPQETAPVAPAPPAVQADAPPQPLAYTPELLRQLNDVNRRINRAIKPARDIETVGVPERWDLPLEEGLKGGDCEDYVLEKRRALVAAGVPLETLSIAVALTRWGEAHAVLLVSTDRGELVLDNLTNWVTPWQDETYRWIERQAPGRTFDWIEIGPKTG